MNITKGNGHHILALERLFNPNSIAVIGASGAEKKLGYHLVRGFTESGYRGNLYAINQTGNTNIFNLPRFNSISEIPGEVELAIIITPPHTMLNLIRECIDKEVKGIVLFASPPEISGYDLVELLDTAKSRGIRILGPNSMGLHCPKVGLSLWPGLPCTTGSVSFIGHSGGMVFSVISSLAAKGIGIQKAIAVGNEWDMNWTDYLEYLGTDKGTEIIAGYIEGVKDGFRFMRVAESIIARKPLILIKGGGSARGNAFTESHTGSMAGHKVIWQAALDQAKIIKAVDFLDLLNHVIIFKYLMNRPLGPRIGIVTAIGGPTVTILDLCEQYGLEVPELSASTKTALAEFIPFYGSSCRNPVDLSIGAAVEPSLYTRSIHILDRSPDIDVIVCVQSDYGGEEVTRMVIEEKGQTIKPLISIMVGATQITDRCIKLYLESGIPAFAYQEGAIRAMKSVIRWKEYSTYSSQ